MAPAFIVIEAERGARRVALRDEVTVGRAAGTSLHLAARNVSRQHARVSWNGVAAFVEDLGSRNGTFVNGERLEARRRLRDGDVVRVGDELLRYAEAEATEDLAEATPPPLPRRDSPPPLRRTPTAPPPLPAPGAPAWRAAPPSPRDEGRSPRRWKDALAAAVRALTGRAPR